MYLPPSYANGFAPRDGEPKYPSLWYGCDYAWHMGLGPTGQLLHDWGKTRSRGTISGSPTWKADSGGYAINFDGTNDVINLPAPAYNQTTYLSAFCWINTSTVQSGKSIFCRYETVSPANNRCWIITSANTSWAVDGIPDGNEFGVSVSGDGGAGASMFRTYWVDTNVFNGVWNHIGFTFSSGTLKLFINGTERTTQKQNDIASNTSLLSTTVPQQIGAVNATAANFFTGLIDDCRVYNRALHPREIALLARRRGIAYEMKYPWYSRYADIATINRRNNMLIGAGF